MQSKHLGALLLTVVVCLCGCTSIPVDQRSEVRHELNERAAETISTMVEKVPDLQQSVDGAVGYFAGRMSATKVPVVGGGYGMGVLHDTENGIRTYMNVTRFDVGGGLGAGRYRVLVLFDNRETLEQFRRGTWKFAIGAESAAGSHSSGALSVAGKGFTVHFYSESGAAVTLTARAVKMSVNEELTDSGVSEVGIPNTGFARVDEQGEDAPRVWNRKLPFMAQKVVDMGYDLPLPYGIGLTYANVDQAQLLDSLEVGINGQDKEPFRFVGFENASSKSDTVSIKADAWLFPFMNIFGMVGRVEGQAPLDVLIDGNGMLDHLEIECPGRPPNPLCPILEDRTFVLPIEANFEGTTYGLGTTLAGGWNNWFVTVPLNMTYADMNDTNTNGLVYTVTPRFGKVLNLGRKGNLALFAGGNYLKSDLKISGTVTTPDGLLVIDYTIEQQNKDAWNVLLGFNWDISRRLSWSAEYDGFIGSRDAFITSLNWRF